VGKLSEQPEGLPEISPGLSEAIPRENAVKYLRPEGALEIVNEPFRRPFRAEIKPDADQGRRLSALPLANFPQAFSLPRFV